MTQNKNEMIIENTERMDEMHEQKAERNAGFLHIVYWTD